jgi:hypothetical protein
MTNFCPFRSGLIKRRCSDKCALSTYIDTEDVKSGEKSESSICSLLGIAMTVSSIQNVVLANRLDKEGLLDRIFNDVSKAVLKNDPEGGIQ